MAYLVDNATSASVKSYTTNMTWGINRGRKAAPRASARASARAGTTTRIRVRVRVRVRARLGLRVRARVTIYHVLWFFFLHPFLITEFRVS